MMQYMIYAAFSIVRWDERRARRFAFAGGTTRFYRAQRWRKKVFDLSQNLMTIIVDPHQKQNGKPHWGLPFLKILSIHFRARVTVLGNAQPRLIQPGDTRLAGQTEWPR
jgi:hypothetical protein